MIDLSGSQLVGANLAYANLSNAVLDRANLDGALLAHASFEASSLVGTSLARASLEYANLKHTYLDRANLQGSMLRWVDLSWASLRKSVLKNCDLSNGNLSYASSDSELRPKFKADFSGSKLSKANLSHTNFCNAQFQGADLERAILVSANLQGSSFINANLELTNAVNANFSGARMGGTKLVQANMSESNLHKADLNSSDMYKANLIKATLSQAILDSSDLYFARLESCDLVSASLRRCNLSGCNLTNSDLSDANLSRATLVDTILDHAILDRCNVYGISAWNVRLDGTSQSGLVISEEGEGLITVDNLKLAQFIYLLVDTREIRNVIDTITSKAVLILGRFSENRKSLLALVSSWLRSIGYMPVIFDFEKPSNRDITETIITLAGMSRFIIVDLTDARSVPQELSHIIPCMPSVPVKPILHNADQAYSMFEHFQRYPWVLPVLMYDDVDNLSARFMEEVVKACESKRSEQLNS
jgi:uncharacterized protein YjbI with pentapeptide repeats